MPNVKTNPSSKALLISPTRRQLGGLRTLMLLAAVAAMAIQLVGIFQEKATRESFGWAFYLPVGVAVLCLLLFFLLGRGGGEIQVFRDRVEGRRSMGVPFAIPMTAIEEILLNPHRLVLKGKDKELLLYEAPADPKTGGLIWLCKQYGDWEVAIWEGLEMGAKSDPVVGDGSFSVERNGFSNTNDGPSAFEKQGFPRATRYFLGEDGTPAFGDHGFLVADWYFPETAMFPIVGQDGQPRRIFLRAETTGATLFQIDPSPDQVPLEAFSRAMVHANAEDARWEELAENHGGNRCVPLQDGIWEGECLGYSVRVEVL